MSGEVSINQQIEEVRRELDLRKKLYPGMVQTRKLRQGQADFHMRRLTAALRTLEYVRDHRDAFMAAVEAEGAKS